MTFLGNLVGKTRSNPPLFCQARGLVERLNRSNQCLKQVQGRRASWCSSRRSASVVERGGSNSNFGWNTSFVRSLCDRNEETMGEGGATNDSGAVAAAAAAPVTTVKRLEYQVHPYHSKQVALSFELDDVTKVKCVANYVRREPGKAVDLYLNGETKPANMKLDRVVVNGKELTQNQEFKVDDVSMTIAGDALKDENTIEIQVSLEPGKNSALSGLYESNHNFCTQMEAEGFRNMMFFIDRPDNLSLYTVDITANKEKFPHMLSNGHDVEKKDLDNGKHFIKWVDPNPKPSYLFALVAGKFEVLRDKFTTREGKDVNLAVYVEKGNLSKTKHAMKSLKESMKWDEEQFNRVYDLDQFNIVSTSFFNMGAMENTSLNVFNDKYVLVDENTATDTDYINVQAVIGHEFFHHWSGNHVTCRDWFQLTLKEGLTVFRDQEFTSTMNSRIAKRVEDVKVLRSIQFPEDASPMAHPIRPDEYQAIDNFYTATVYEKGAEVIRMIQTIVTPQGFRKGLDLYFERHDGQAVRCEEFVKAMEDANPGTDLSQFLSTWYSQAGTPVIEVNTSYDETDKSFKMKIKQSCPATPGQEKKVPFDIPVAVGLIGSESKTPLVCQLKGSSGQGQDTVVLRLVEEEQEFVFQGVAEKPVPSILRGYSAPVRLECPSLSRQELMFLAAHDVDPFVRYDSLVQLATQVLMDMTKVSDPSSVTDLSLVIKSLRQTLSKVEQGPIDQDLGPVVALSLSLPDEFELAELCEAGTANVEAISRACSFAGKQVAVELSDILEKVYLNAKDPHPDESDGQAMSRRALKNAALRLLLKNPDHPTAKSIASKQFESAQNMTDRWGALVALRSIECQERTKASEAFYEIFKDENLVMNKWLMFHALSNVPNSLSHIKGLTKHPVFSFSNPNKVYALIKAIGRNFNVFHDKSGAGYEFMADQILTVDKLNPQAASRLAKTMTNWRDFSAPWSTNMKSQLERIASHSDLSADVFEVIHKALDPPSSSL